MYLAGREREVAMGPGYVGCKVRREFRNGPRFFARTSRSLAMGLVVRLIARVRNGPRLLWWPEVGRESSK